LLFHDSILIGNLKNKPSPTATFLAASFFFFVSVFIKKKGGGGFLFFFFPPHFFLCPDQHKSLGRAPYIYDNLRLFSLNNI